MEYNCFINQNNITFDSNKLGHNNKKILESNIYTEADTSFVEIIFKAAIFITFSWCNQKLYKKLVTRKAVNLLIYHMYP